MLRGNYNFIKRKAYFEIKSSSDDPFREIQEKYRAIYVIVAPPRSSSTAFARVFWKQPSVRYYSHEPFEVTYFMRADLRQVVGKLKNPIDLWSDQKYAQANDLVIKEMPYQVGGHFDMLVSLATFPIVFLIRDPRLNIFSRIVKKREANQNRFFPLIESGWELLASQIKQCKEQGIPYMIVDSTDFRNHPAVIFEQVFERLYLPFSIEMLSWQPRKDIDLDNLGGDHYHLYRKVLESTGIYPATEPIPAIEAFPITGGFRDHVRACLRIYDALRDDSARLQVTREIRNEN